MAGTPAIVRERAPAGPAIAGSGRSVRRIWNARWCYLFAAPGLVLAAMFSIWPAVASWYYSLVSWSGFTAHKTFVGLQNYRAVVHDRFFWRAFAHSFEFMAVNVPVRLVISLAIAIVLNDQALRLAPLFRTLFFIPVVTTEAIVGILWSFLYSPFHGPVNDVLRKVDLIHAPIDFLGNPHTALWAIVSVSVWKSLGIPMIYWLAALQIVPRELYEAARVDGAGWLRQHLSVTLPLLAPFAAVIVLITAVDTLHVFALVQSTTAGGPYFSTDVVETFIYRTAFGAEQGTVPRLGYASAAAVLFGLAVMVIAVLQLLAVRRVRSLRRELGSR